MQKLGPFRKTVIFAGTGDTFVPKLLRSIQEDRYEPISIDVLVKVNKSRKPNAMIHALEDVPWPPSTNLYFYEESDSGEFFIQGAGSSDSFHDFLSRHEKIAFWSITADNAKEIILSVRALGSARVTVLCSDDEVERHAAYKTMFSQNPEKAHEYRKKFKYSIDVEQAFEIVFRFMIPKYPWKSMLEIGRKNTIELLPFICPFKNNFNPTIKPRSEKYKVIAFPKPSVGLSEFNRVFNLIRANLVSTNGLEICTFRNDLHPRHAYTHEDQNIVLTSYPYPISESFYHELIANADAMIIVPRGGMSITRDAVRYGLDLITANSLTPNNITLRDDFGIKLFDVNNVLNVCPRRNRLSSPEELLLNQERLYAYESRSKFFFRKEFL